MNRSLKMEGLFPSPPPLLDSTSRSGIWSRSEVESNAKSFSDLNGLSTRQTELFRCALFLWNDHWSQAHNIAQNYEGDSAFDVLHSILHRREGDFFNARYWLRAASAHSCYSRIALLLAAAGEDESFNPLRFYGEVEKEVSQGNAHNIELRGIQAMEIKSLLKDELPASILDLE